MTQPPPKKSGSRDISALKERLRPKTGAPAARAPAAPAGSVLPPPGLDIPPPPGVATQQPAAPAVPDAHTDPFGHMNAMAQMGAAQRAPEIVIVHDGKPVETVATHHRLANIAKFVGIAIVPLLIGIAIRGISKDAHAFNAGVVGARIVNKQVQDVKKALGKVQDAVYSQDGIEAKEAAKKNTSGREVTAALQAFDKLDLDPGIVFKAKQNNIGAQLSAQVLEFYAGVAELKQMVADHVRLARNDDAALGKALEETKKLVLPKEQQAGVALRYAVMVVNPPATDTKTAPGARIVEVGPPFCGNDDKPSTTGGCPEGKPPTAISIRTEPDGFWTKGDFLPLGGGEAVPSGKVIAIAPTDIFVRLAQSPEGAAAEAAYQKRLQHIKEKLAEVMKLANDLEKPLSDKARAKQHFTFFM